MPWHFRVKYHRPERPDLTSFVPTARLPGGFVLDWCSIDCCQEDDVWDWLSSRECYQEEANEVLALGTVLRLQVQGESLKVGVPPQRRYDPSPISSVAALTLSERGVHGWTEEGSPMPDVHNLDHPSSKNRGGTNGISICFTSHYASMREQFGDHLDDGLAGENMLVETSQILAEDHLNAGIVIKPRNGKSILLQEITVAAPCVEFSRYALRFPDDARPDHRVTEALRFLNGGMRGFYATYSGEPATVQVGDQVFCRLHG
jgi:hypothetical protein